MPPNLRDGYSPHYLMFGCRPRLPVDFYFPNFRNAEAPFRGTSAKCVDEYVVTVHNQLRAAFWEAQAQSMAEAQWQKQYYDQKIGAMDMKPGNLVLVKDDAFKGKRKIKDRWEDEACKVVHQIMTDIPSYKVICDRQTNVDSHASSTKTNFFSLHQRLAFPCVWVSTKHRADVPAPTQLSQLPKGVMMRLCHK